MSATEVPHAPSAALNTSEGARRFIADFFATELRRHDFTRYITTELAADFACALAQHLSTRQPAAQEPVAGIDPRHLFLMAGKDGTLSGNVLRFGASMQPGDAPLYAAPPAQGIDLGQLWEPIKEAVHTALSVHVSALSQKKREQVAVYVARQLREGQRDVAPGVGNG